MLSFFRSPQKHLRFETTVKTQLLNIGMGEVVWNVHLLHPTIWPLTDQPRPKLTGAYEISIFS
jgi:hypothetical protein